MYASYKKTLNFYKKLEKSIEKYPYYFYCRASNLFNNYIKFNLNLLHFEKKRETDLNLFFYNLLLLLISLFTIIKVKLKKIKIAHYLIDINNSNDRYDFRSKFMLNKIRPDNTINFFHISSFKYSIKSFLEKDNPIYFESLFYFLRFFIKAEKFEIRVNLNNFTKKEKIFVKSIIKEYSKEVKDSYKQIIIYTKLLKFLKIERFYFIDDSRNTNELIIASNNNKIKTIGYMHARFNEFFVGLNYYPFDNYLVFSKYFKNLILKMNKNYKKNRIQMIGQSFFKNLPKENRDYKKEKINVLILGELHTNYKEEVKFYNLLIKDKSINLFYRGKPGFNINFLQSFLDENRNDINYINDDSFLEAITKNKIDIVIGIYSTALIESLLVNVPSIMIKSFIDLSFHFREDKLVYYCDKKDELIPLIKKINNLSKIDINKKKKLVWGV